MDGSIGFSTTQSVGNYSESSFTSQNKLKKNGNIAYFVFEKNRGALDVAGALGDRGGYCFVILVFAWNFPPFCHYMLFRCERKFHVYTSPVPWRIMRQICFLAALCGMRCMPWRIIRQEMCAVTYYEAPMCAVTHYAAPMRAVTHYAAPMRAVTHYTTGDVCRDALCGTDACRDALCGTDACRDALYDRRCVPWRIMRHRCVSWATKCLSATFNVFLHFFQQFLPLAVRV